MLCKSPRLKINDRIVLGREINGIKSKNGFNLLGHNVWIAPKWREGFLGDFTTRGMVNPRMVLQKRVAQKLLSFFLKESKISKKCF